MNIITIILHIFCSGPRTYFSYLIKIIIEIMKKVQILKHMGNYL